MAFADRKQLIAALSIEVKQKLNGLMPNHDRRNIVYRLASELFDIESLPSLEQYLQSPGFAVFIEPRKSAGVDRLERILTVILERLALEIPAEKMEQISASMSDPAYISVERSFYRIPIDIETCMIFEKNYVRIGEQNIALLPEYLRIFSSQSFFILKKTFNEQHKTVFHFVLDKFVHLLLSYRDSYFIIRQLKALSDDAIFRFIRTAIELEVEDHFINQLFISFFEHKELEVFWQVLQTYSQKYKIRNQKQEAIIFERLLNIWPLINILKEEELVEFATFLKNYGSFGDEFRVFVWDAVFSCPIQKITRIMQILNSSSFQSIQRYYSQESKVLRFLITNILAAVVEMDVRNFSGNLYKFVLKILLELKVDRNFMKRRAIFFHILKKQTHSLKLELEVIRFIFFEYIFIATGQIADDYYRKMTRFCDEDHRFYCNWVDGKYLEYIRLNVKDREKFFMPLIERLREMIWRSTIKKFEKYNYHLKEVAEIGINNGYEDFMIEQLDKIEIKNFVSYRDSLVSVFRNYPEKISEAICADYWYRFELSSALSHLYSILLPVIGIIQIQKGQSGAYTDGKTIFLPEYINYFKDPSEPVIENRNLSVYIALGLHEAGHILAGTFQFNLSYYLIRLEKPNLFKTIYNFFEDFRIESFLIEIKVHPQVKDLLDTLNEYYSLKAQREDLPFAGRFICHIYDEAFGYNERLKSIPTYQEFRSKIKEVEVNTGRFSNLQQLFDYGITRLKNLALANPLACYPLTREFYEILKYWPQSYLEGFAQPDSIPKGIHQREDSQILNNGPLDEKDLETLYQTYNDNPQQFLQNYNLPIFPELIDDSCQVEDIPIANDYTKDILQLEHLSEYEQAGSIDFSHRTRADNLSAQERMKNPSNFSGKKVKSQEKDKKHSSKKTKVYSIDSKTGSRTKISEIEEFIVSKVDIDFLVKVKKWQPISDRVTQVLADLLPSLHENFEQSSQEGELNIEMLLEVLSSENRLGSFEIFDIFRETTRSLEVAIGIDASGSTAMPLESGDQIFDIEKAFAIIFARALNRLTENITVFSFDSITATNVYRATSIDAISGFEIGYNNRDGDFIRYVSQHLKKSSADVKYFFMISDGQPSADNYYGKEALNDTLIAFRESVNDGIKLIYFNIDIERGDYFNAFQQEATFAEYFTHPEDLLPVIPSMVQTVIRSIR